MYLNVIVKHFDAIFAKKCFCFFDRQLSKLSEYNVMSNILNLNSFGNVEVNYLSFRVHVSAMFSETDGHMALPRGKTAC